MMLGNSIFYLPKGTIAVQGAGFRVLGLSDLGFQGVGYLDTGLSVYINNYETLGGHYLAIAAVFPSPGLLRGSWDSNYL